MAIKSVIAYVAPPLPFDELESLLLLWNQVSRFWDWADKISCISLSVRWRFRSDFCTMCASMFISCEAKFSAWYWRCSWKYFKCLKRKKNHEMNFLFSSSFVFVIAHMERIFPTMVFIKYLFIWVKWNEKYQEFFTALCKFSFN